MSDPLEVGVSCGDCGGGPIYFEACPEHTWANIGECHACGSLYRINDGCPECGWRSDLWIFAKPMTTMEEP